MSERKSPPGPREIIQEVGPTATFYPIAFQEEVAPHELPDEPSQLDEAESVLDSGRGK
jgi:hypothetical protein